MVSFPCRLDRSGTFSGHRCRDDPTGLARQLQIDRVNITVGTGSRYTFVLIYQQLDQQVQFSAVQFHRLHAKFHCFNF